MRTYRVLALLGLFTLPSCSGPSAPNDADLLETIGINSPIAIGFNPANVAMPDGTLADAVDTALAASFLKAGLIDTVPTDHSPYWQFSSPSGTTFTAGQRTVDSREDVRIWRDGSVDWFAETIRYHIQPSDQLSKAGIQPSAILAVRLVASNNPAVGHWQLDPSQSGTLNDASTLEEGIIQAGTNLEVALANSIQSARVKSFDAFAQKLEDQGILERSSVDGNVAISKRQHVYLYLAPLNITGRSLADLEPICNSLKSKIKGVWHAPVYQDIASTIVDNFATNVTRLYDTPDRRFFAQLVPVPHGNINFVTTDWEPYMNFHVTTKFQLFDNDLGGRLTDIRSDPKEKLLLTQADRLICMMRIPGT